MEHLNLCRQVTKQFSERLQIPSIDRTLKARMAHVVDLAAASQKFMLPDGGLLMDDLELRAIDETMSLRLPHKFIALEFLHAPDESRPHAREKHILFAREREGFIHLSGCSCYGHDDRWAWLPECAIPTTDYLDRSAPGGIAKVTYRPLSLHDTEPGDYDLYLKTLMCFLNALQCSNVHIEKSAARKGSKKAKAALPFDSYHVLNIDLPRRLGSLDGAGSGASHRSPREHLRRGHIVRPEGRRPFWRNATIVNAAKAGGRIEKAYNVRGPTAQAA